MPLQNALPLNATPGFTWSSVAPNQIQELITVYNAEELDTLNQAPETSIAWADQGSLTSQGVGIVKVPIRLPQSLGFTEFDYGGTRTYQSLDVAAPVIRVNPWNLNFAWPMIWDSIGNGWKLMSEGGDGLLQEFTGAVGLGNAVITAGRAHKAQLVATLFYAGYTSAALSLTAKIKTVPQPGLPNGNDFFTDGVGAPLHYSHPFMVNSGRFQNAWPAYGAFATNFGRSLTEMTRRPHPTLPNNVLPLQTTDIFGPTHMRDRFWTMGVSMLALQVATVSGNGVAAAPINPFAVDTIGRYNASNFLGASGFAPYRFWIAPQLDNHPYVQAHLTDGPGGGPADFWITTAAMPGNGSYAYLASNSKVFTPFARFYGAGDPRAQSERRARLETDLDGGVAGGLYHNVNMFMGV